MKINIKIIILVIFMVLLHQSVIANNVILIIVDDLRYDALSIEGHPVRTPSIDKLATEGVRFNNHFAVQSICAPSRATMLTGVYSHRHGVTGNSIELKGIETLADALAPSHRTGMIGKWHLGNNYSKVPKNWNEFYALWGQGLYNDPIIYDMGHRITVPGYSTDILTDRALKFIEKPGQFFLYLSYKGVHSPWIPAKRHAGTLSKIDWKSTDRPSSTNTAASRKQIYMETLLSVDDNIGRLLDKLKELKLEDDTLVIFTSDNGMHHLEHGRHDKRTFFEESIRIPLIMRMVNIVGGQTRSVITLNTDIAPTILDYTNTNLSHEVDGMSLLPVMHNSIAQTRFDWLYTYFRDIEFPDLPTMYAWITPSYKYVIFPDGPDLFCYFSGRPMLFNRNYDVFEMNNLLQNNIRRIQIPYSLANDMTEELHRLNIQWKDYDNQFIWDRILLRMENNMSYANQIPKNFPNGFNSINDRVCTNGTFWN